MANLITVPNFVFQQEYSDGSFEQPIWVQYYNGTISLEQDGQSISILPECLTQLFKEIKKHQDEAEKWLKKR